MATVWSRKYAWSACSMLLCQRVKIYLNNKKKWMFICQRDTGADQKSYQWPKLEQFEQQK